MVENNTAVEPVEGIVHTGPGSGGERVKERSDKSGLYGVLILLIVLALAGAGYFFLQQLRSKQEGIGGEMHKDDQQMLQMGEQITSLQSHMTTLQSQMATMQDSLTTRESKLERSLAEFTEQHGTKLDLAKDAFSDSINDIHRQLGKTRGDWMIADAEYLLTVANQRLQLVGDVKTSLKALEAADERLRESGNPGVFKAREAIAVEIDSLKAIKPLDVSGVFADIKVLERQVEQLPIFLPHTGKMDSEQQKDIAKKEEQAISEVDDFLGSAIEDLKGLVVIRRHERSAAAILIPEEVALIREDLRIKLEIARMAVLARDDQLFHVGVDEVRSWVLEHFENDAPETKKFLADLENLAKVAVHIDFPDISGSLKLLQKSATTRLGANTLQPKKVNKPKTDQPKAKQPEKASKPKTDQPKAKQPDSRQPKKQQPLKEMAPQGGQP